jgi:hypothetical protein
MYAYIPTEQRVTQLDQALYDSWVANGNPKANYYLPISDPPGPGAVYDGTDWVLPPPYIPQQVTRFQALAALSNAGLLAQAQAIIDDPNTPEISKLAWANALHFERSSPTLQGLAQALGLSATDLDDLFITASGITA